MKLLRVVPIAAGLALAMIVSTGFVSGASAQGEATLAAPSSLTFTDPAGDASSAPDITNVAISGDASTGVLTFTVTAPGLEPANPDGLMRSVDFFLDTDRNSSTGSAGGHEYDLYVWNDSTNAAAFYWDVGRWVGTGWQEVPMSATLGAHRSGDVFTLTVSTADLGGTTSFALHTVSGAYDANGNAVARDFAPDGLLTWVYDIAGPTRTMTKLVFPVIGKMQATPAQLKGGSRVTVAFPVTWSPNGKSTPLTSGKMVCDPSVAAKVIPHAESFKNGVARLSFLVPKTARGKQLKVKVTITAPSYQEPNGTWIDAASAEMGITASSINGQSTTKIVTLPVR
jgi:hypothetical protein